GGALLARIEHRSEDASWRAATGQPFPLRFAALFSPEAGPVTVRPAWEPGKPGTNFAHFHTSAGGDTHDAFGAGTRVDVPIASAATQDDGSILARSAEGTLEAIVRPGPGATFEVVWTFTAPEAGY